MALTVEEAAEGEAIQMPSVAAASLVLWRQVTAPVGVEVMRLELEVLAEGSAVHWRIVWEAAKPSPADLAVVMVQVLWMAVGAVEVEVETQPLT